MQRRSKGGHIRESEDGYSSIKSEKISRFASSHGLEDKIFQLEDDLRVRVISDKSMSVSEKINMQSVQNLWNEVKGELIALQCIHLAFLKGRRFAGTGSEVIYSKNLDGGNGLVQLSNHALRLQRLKNKSVAVFDFSAWYHIDSQQGNYDVLIITADNLSNLKAYLSELYGGNWNFVRKTGMHKALHRTMTSF